MLVTTKIISFDDANEEIDQFFYRVVKTWLDTTWGIIESRVTDEEVRVGVKEMLDSVITPNSPSELDSSISWGWQVSKMETIGSGTVGKLVLYVADATLVLKKHEGITRVSVTEKGKTLHVETEIVV